MSFRKGNIVKFRGKQSGNMRVVHVNGDKVIVEHVYKTDYRGDVVKSKPGYGVKQEVNRWEIVKVKGV